MSDDKKRKKDDSNLDPRSGENRGGGNVWLVLAAITSLVLLAAFLFSSSERRLRYPDLLSLLEAQAKAQASGQGPVGD